MSPSRPPSVAGRCANGRDTLTWVPTPRVLVTCSCPPCASNIRRYRRRNSHTRRSSPPRKASGDTIRIPRKGLSEIKSLSPVMICVACPLAASSRNLSSFGSRHARIASSISTHSAFRRNAARNCRPSSSEIYFRNFGRASTSWISDRTGGESNTFPLSSARSKACREGESVSKRALTMTLVSRTKRKLRALQESIEDLRSEALSFRPPTDVFHQSLQV